MRDVSISQYYGFAIVAVNLPNDNLDSINITGSQGIWYILFIDYK